MQDKNQAIAYKIGMKQATGKGGQMLMDWEKSYLNGTVEEAIILTWSI